MSKIETIARARSIIKRLYGKYQLKITETRNQQKIIDLQDEIISKFENVLNKSRAKSSYSTVKWNEEKKELAPLREKLKGLRE